MYKLLRFFIYEYNVYVRESLKHGYITTHVMNEAMNKIIHQR